MSKAQVFKLKQDLVFPAEKNAKTGATLSYLTYPREAVAITFLESARNHLSNEVVLSLVLVDIEQPDFIVKKLGEMTFGADGIPHPDGSLENQKAYNDWHNEATALREEQATTERTKENEQRLEEIHQRLAELDIAPVIPIPVRIFPYKQVLSFFSDEGDLTEAGVQWGKSISFMGKTIGDFLDTDNR